MNRADIGARVDLPGVMLDIRQSRAGERPYNTCQALFPLFAIMETTHGR